MEIITFNRTSNIIRVKIADTSVTTNAGKTGLTYSSTGLIISTIANNEASATVYTAAAGNIETISTLGTYAAPTSGKCRFKEVDATNHPGVYEIQIADARFAVANATSLIVSILGASGAAQCDLQILLTRADFQDSVRAGLTSLPNYAAGAANGLITSGTGAGQLNPVTGRIGIDLAQTQNPTYSQNWSGTTIKAVTDAVTPPTDQAVNVTKIAGAAVNTALAQLGVNVVSQANIDFGALQKASITAAVPTVIAIVSGIDAALAEPSAGDSPDSPTLTQAVNWIYRRLFNKNVTTIDKFQIFMRDESSKMCEQTYSDSGTELTIGEAKAAV
jgi:hypothetical protein